METMEICRLSREAVGKLLEQRAERFNGDREQCQRRTPRWPFPGTVELWIPDEAGRQWHTLATSVDLSNNGIGVHCDQALLPGTTLDLAIHEPEMSFHGQAVVRHCSVVREGAYLVGMQFLFGV